MNIHEMSDEDLSRAIAESIEPKPAYEFIAARTPENAALQMNLRCWRPSFRDYYDAHGHNKYVPVPRDMVNDPAMSMMLLEKLALERIIALDILDDGSASILTARLELLCEAKSFGRAIAEAFALSLQE